MLSEIKRDDFKGKQRIVFYANGDDVWIKRTAIGEALGYAHPRNSMAKLHHRHKDILAENTILARPNYEINDMAFYNLKAIIDVCHISDQTDAQWFKDWVSERIRELKYDSYFEKVV